jgi:multidrug efflux pump subunit AcrA (membrane-fusion protein)
MIAAAEAREKKHKKLTKTTKYVTKSTLLKQQQLKEDRHQQIQQQQQATAAEPQTEASRRAAQDAKRAEAEHVAQLGYNPYEAIKKTAGQARTATTATQHGAIVAPGGGGSAPSVMDIDHTTTTTTTSSSIFRDDPNYPYHEFEEALATICSFSNQEAAKSGLKISKKLITNATTKGQQSSVPDAEKFRRVRLANPKIKAAIVDVPGNLPLMMSVGFELLSDDSNPDESILVFPPACKGPTWLFSHGMEKMEQAETAYYMSE